MIRELKKQRIADDQLLHALHAAAGADRSDRAAREPGDVADPQGGDPPGDAGGVGREPAPHIDPPRLIGNTGEPAEFVLPTSNPNAAPGTVMDDFNYDAIAWTLTAHEARPGHELQFASMLEQGVSTARVVFALNSANVEGWALYAEAVLKKYLPPEGQIGALQMRMMREARAFLDPMLNLGMIEPEAAKRFLMEEVMLSEPMAKQEVDRYTFQAPGQATSYFYGYSRLNACARASSWRWPENSTSTAITISSWRRGRCRSTCWSRRSARSSWANSGRNSQSSWAFWLHA